MYFSPHFPNVIAIIIHLLVAFAIPFCVIVSMVLFDTVVYVFRAYYFQFETLQSMIASLVRSFIECII